MKAAFVSYLIRVGDATSQWVNVAFLFGENPNESISGRAWRMHDESKVWGIAYWTINKVFFLEDNHCEAAFLSDYQRAAELVRGD